MTRRKKSPRLRVAQSLRRIKTRANAGMITLLKTKRILPNSCRPLFIQARDLFVGFKWRFKNVIVLSHESFA